MLFCVSNEEEVISEFKNSQHKLENIVIFIYNNKCVFSKSHGCPNTNGIMTIQWPLFTKNMTYVPLIC